MASSSVAADPTSFTCLSSERRGSSRANSISLACRGATRPGLSRALVAPPRLLPSAEGDGKDGAEVSGLEVVAAIGEGFQHDAITGEPGAIDLHPRIIRLKLPELTELILDNVRVQQTPGFGVRVELRKPESVLVHPLCWLKLPVGALQRLVHVKDVPDLFGEFPREALREAVIFALEPLPENLREDPPGRVALGTAENPAVTPQPDPLLLGQIHVPSPATEVRERRVRRSRGPVKANVR